MINIDCMLEPVLKRNSQTIGIVVYRDHSVRKMEMMLKMLLMMVAVLIATSFVNASDKDKTTTGQLNELVIRRIPISEIYRGNKYHVLYIVGLLNTAI